MNQALSTNNIFRLLCVLGVLGVWTVPFCFGSVATTQPATQPATQAAAATPPPRTTWLFADCNDLARYYWPQVFTRVALTHDKVVDGVLVMGVLDPASSNWAGPPEVNLMQVCLTCKWVQIQAIPGVRALGGGTKLADWFDRARWQKVVDFARATVRDGRFCLDIEPPWNTEPRYPGAERVLELTAAMQPLIDYARESQVKLYVLPGAQYTATLALALALPGQVVALDEATYGYGLAASRPADWPEQLRARKAAAAALNVEWWPGFYWPGHTDGDVQALGGPQWFYLRPADRANFINGDK